MHCMDGRSTYPETPVCCDMDIIEIAHCLYMYAYVRT